MANDVATAEDMPTVVSYEDEEFWRSFGYSVNVNRNARYTLYHPNHAKDWWLELKIEVLTHYGNGELACVRCKESRLACLSIDHIDGGGVRAREKNGRGHAYYLYLRKNNYPKGYQTLCMNCQFIKAEENREHNGNRSDG